ncbi:hypothetical protein FB451DRAFT_1234812, partial [Mycena latifolia]
MPAARCSECGGPVPSSVAEGPESHIDVARTPTTLARHQELMTTNEPPECAELAFIQEVGSKTDAKLADVEREISRLQDRIQQLQDERASLAIYRAQNTAILSPLRRMPPEVLGEIFSWTLPSINTASHKFRKSRSHGRWRAVALSTPSLWSQIGVDYRLKLTHPSSISMIKTQIERAHQLRIHFYGTEKGPSHPQIEMFRCLAAHCSRWEELSIRLTAPIVPLLASIRNHIPSLQRLKILWEGPESQIGTAPSLFDISILSRYRYLTRYDLDGTWETHRNILKLALNLVEVRIDIRSDEDERWPDEIINLTLLRRLYVSYPKILEYLRAPALQDIGFSLEENEGPEFPLGYLEPFIVRSGWIPLAHTAAKILQKFPSVSELVMIVHDPDYDRANTFISSLTIPNPTASAVLSPQLTTIYFGCSGSRCIDFTLYLKMLQSR